MPKNDRLIDGFYFETDALYEEAHKEKLAVAYLAKQVDLTDNKQALRLYQQAVSQKLFSTVIGLSFLRDLELRLKKDASIPKDQIIPVPISAGENPSSNIAPPEDKTLKKQTTNYIEVDDYIIEYILVFETGNGEKVKNKDFIYHAYLSEFADKEQTFINQIIKLRTSVKESATTETVVAETTII